MLSDPITLYKLMILYMLAHVNFPLTNSQLTDFFLDHEYTTYFTLQQALNELREAGLLKMESIHNSSRYEITREGEDTLSFFGSNISPAIVSDIDGYLKAVSYTHLDVYKRQGPDRPVLWCIPPLPQEMPAAYFLQCCGPG